MSDYILTFNFNINIIYTLMICMLLIVSACFSCSETAITCTSKSRIRYLNKTGLHHNANVVYNLLHNRNRVIGNILIGNNIANIFASSLATVLLTNIVGAQGFLVASVVMSIIIIIFTEITPKQYALHYPETICLTIAPALRLVNIILYPILFCVEKISNYIIRLLPMSTVLDVEENMSTEIKGAIDLYQSRGYLDKQQADMIDNIFNIHKIPIKSALIPLDKTIMIDIDQDLEKIIQHMLHHTYDNFPVYQGQKSNIIGIISLRDIFRTYIQNQKMDREQLLSLIRKAYFLPEEKTLLQQIIWFQKHKQQMIITVNKDKQPTGIITLQDITTDVVDARLSKQKLPYANNQIQILKDGSIITDADTKIADINLICNSRLPEKTLTIAGFVIQQQKKQKNQDKKIVYGNLHISVIKNTAHKIQKVKIKSVNNSLLHNQEML